MRHKSNCVFGLRRQVPGTCGLGLAVNGILPGIHRGIGI
jgi:hypothetical protein